MVLKIAIDAAGGDNGPSAVLLGIEKFLQTYKDKLHFSLYGDEQEITPFLSQTPLLQKCSVIHHTLSKFDVNATLLESIRRSAKTSMGLAVSSVAKKENDAVISCGETGIFMALSKMYIKTFSDIDRPALPGFFPALKGKTLMMDLGANVECTPKRLVQFALMASSYASILLKKENPTVALLNIGTEDGKGDDVLKDTAGMFETHPQINYKGFVEGSDILKGKIDIIITDGFTGNVALKTIEGAAEFIYKILSTYFASSMRGKLCYLIARPILKKVFKVLDQRTYNGAPFLGLKGIAVKSHGNSDAVAFTYAVELTVNLIKEKLPERIQEKLGENNL
jgi:glycerol-3-phosphate acyltransferase PlsX